MVRPGESRGEHDIIDTDGHAHRAYDVQDGTLVLIRPDGYIGLIADRTSPASVNDYLRSVPLRGESPKNFVEPLSIQVNSFVVQVRRRHTMQFLLLIYSV